AAPAQCATPSGNSPPPMVLSAASGAAGTSVGVSGVFQTGQLWFQLLWNANADGIPSHVQPPPWRPSGPHLNFAPAGPGPVVAVASVPGPGAGGTCSWHTRFTVP